MITPISSWKKSLYLAKRVGVERDINKNQVEVFDTPIELNMNYQPLSEDTRIEMFGTNSKEIYRAVSVAPYQVFNISEMDRVYLNGKTPTGETVNGENANFVVKRVSTQNVLTSYYFESIKG